MIDRVPLAPDDLRKRLEEELTALLAERSHDDPAKPRRRQGDTEELRLRHLLGILGMMQEVAVELGSDVATLSVVEERHSWGPPMGRVGPSRTETLIVFSLTPASSAAAPIAIAAGRGDEVTLRPGHGEVEHWNAHLDAVEGFVRYLRSYVDLAIQGNLREVYWVDGFGEDVRVLSAKTYFRIEGRWRRQGQVGGRRDGRRVARDYEPYR